MHYIVVNSPTLALISAQMLDNALPFPVIGLVYASVIDRNTTIQSSDFLLQKVH